uniref:Uncharacterized protein n=1 Tax=Panagrolaimus sp. ES5 TaxID=591445 RepID=A0AC34GAI8_9BILA
MRPSGIEAEYTEILNFIKFITPAALVLNKGELNEDQRLSPPKKPRSDDGDVIIGDTIPQFRSVFKSGKEKYERLFYDKFGKKL